MIQRGDRVTFVFDGLNIRGTVLSCGNNATGIRIISDDRVFFLIPHSLMSEHCVEKIIRFKAHSADYLRSLPAEQRPSIY